MRDWGLTFRMVIASLILTSIYAVVGLFLFEFGGLWMMAIGIPLIIGVQYFVTVQLPLWRNECLEITPGDYPKLHKRFDELAEEFNIEKPRVYLAETERKNAFALGRRRQGKVFLTRGLINQMSAGELEAIVAHEFAHLKNRDSVLMKLGTSIAVAASSVLFILFFLVSLDSDHPWLVRTVGGILSGSLYFFLLVFVRIISRYREYVADEEAVQTTGRYNEMLSALSKLKAEEKQVNQQNRITAQSAINFVGFSGNWGSRLIATHPSLEKRISRIEELKNE